jgi:hypothetical protein
MLSWVGLEFFAQLPLPDKADKMVETTALGILSIAVVGMFRAAHAMLKAHQQTLKETLASHQQTIDKICDRWDRTQESQHSDWKAVESALTQTREHCAAVQAEAASKRSAEQQA